MSLDPPEAGDGESPGPSKTKPLLRPGSRYGQRLRPVTTYAAVGAAMQSARVRAQEVGAPI